MRFNKIVKVFLLLSLTTFFIGCSSAFTYTEGNIYSESNLENYYNKESESEAEDFMTREDAIEYALKIFKEGFNEEILRDKANEYINLSKYKDDFYWNINWEVKEEGGLIKQFYILINTKTKKVESAWLDFKNSTLKESYNDESYYIDGSIDDEEELNTLLNVILPVIKTMELDINNYVSSGFYREGKGVISLKTANDYYEFIIDLNTKELISFNM